MDSERESYLYKNANNYTYEPPSALKGFSAKELSVVLRGIYESHGSIYSGMIGVNNDPLIIFEIKGLITTKYILDTLGIVYASSSDPFDYKLKISGYNAFDLMVVMYENALVGCRSESEYRIYCSMVHDGPNWSNQIDVSKFPLVCNFTLTLPDAVLPSKGRASDVGYDLTIVSKVKDIFSNCALYDTGVIVEPPFGYYTKIVPRSSLIKSGYILSNSQGIIDGTYRGTLKICLTKVSPDAPDIELPFKCCQLILDQAIHYKANKTESVTETSRGDGGFGSTDKLR